MHGVVEIIGPAGVAEVDVEREVDLQRLGDLPFVRERTDDRHGADGGNLDLVGHRAAPLGSRTPETYRRALGSLPRQVRFTVGGAHPFGAEAVSRTVVPDAHRGLDRHCAAVRGDRGVDDRQTEAAPAPMARPCRVGPVEAFGDPGSHVGWHARPVVGHLDDDVVVTA